MKKFTRRIRKIAYEDHHKHQEEDDKEEEGMKKTKFP